MNEIPVIFRREKGGQIIALLPTMAAGANITSCKAFSLHYGWFITDTGIMRTTDEPTPDEYMPLLNELIHTQRIYPVKLCKRVLHWMEEIRFNQLTLNKVA